MNNALSWARQYIVVPDAMYREYVENLLRMAEGFESASKLVELIEHGFALNADDNGYQEALQAVWQLRDIVKHNKAALHVGAYAPHTPGQNCPDCGRPAGPYICTCKLDGCTLEDAKSHLLNAANWIGVDMPEQAIERVEAALYILRRRMADR